MINIHQAETDKDRALIRELFWEYLEWANTRLNEEYDINLPIKSMLERDMAKLDIFLPPYGRLLLATQGSRAAGIACMRRIRTDIGEIKRMYVRSEFRGRGIGRALLEALIAEAQEIGYPTLRLEYSLHESRPFALSLGGLSGDRTVYAKRNSFRVSATLGFHGEAVIAMLPCGRMRAVRVAWAGVSPA